MTIIAETAESGEVDLGRRPGRWIAHWAPEDAGFWRAVGSRIARRNLIFSIFAEHIGFSVWLLWSIVVVRLGDVGWQLTTSQKLWLTAVPSGVGALLRLPYTFAVPVFGGRNWTIAAGALGVISSIGAFGGFLVPICYAWAKSTYGGIQPALRFYVAFFVLLLAVAWVAYVRPGSRMARAGV